MRRHLTFLNFKHTLSHIVKALQLFLQGCRSNVKKKVHENMLPLNRHRNSHVCASKISYVWVRYMIKAPTQISGNWMYFSTKAKFICYYTAKWSWFFSGFLLDSLCSQVHIVLFHKMSYLRPWGLRDLSFFSNCTWVRRPAVVSWATVGRTCAAGWTQ